MYLSMNENIKERFLDSRRETFSKGISTLSH
jgi:hypothetical protein